ncbi:MAG: hypothetical protein LBK72_01945, partial [Bifidobacteriaceae bacterium]|nr:hypothetical protein [Bifidobacteriaceae bacterium]
MSGRLGGRVDGPGGAGTGECGAGTGEGRVDGRVCVWPGGCGPFACPRQVASHVRRPFYGWLSSEDVGELAVELSGDVAFEAASGFA